jgi:hypothetical protein
MPTRRPERNIDNRRREILRGDHVINHTIPLSPQRDANAPNTSAFCR